MSIYIRGFRTFLRWLYIEGLKPENLALVIKAEKANIRMEDLPTEQELLTMLNACREDKQATRDRALILMFLDTGLRLGEMTLLQKQQLHPDPDGQTMRMEVYTPKTKSKHFAYLGLETTRALHAY